MSQEDVEGYLAFTSESILGSVHRVLKGRGDNETRALLAYSNLSYRSIEWQERGYDRGWGVYAVLVVEPAQYDYFTEELRQVILDLLQAAHAIDDGIHVLRLVVVPRPVDDDWRAEHRVRHSSPSAILTTGRSALPPARDGAELIVVGGFISEREQLAPHDTIGISTNVPVSLLGSTVEVDVEVTYRGRTAVIEMDGDTHRRANRYAADHSRDQLLRNAGYHVDRVCAEDMNDPQNVTALVRKTLSRLRGSVGTSNLVDVG
jgi:hypothetical protein